MHSIIKDSNHIWNNFWISSFTPLSSFFHNSFKGNHYYQVDVYLCPLFLCLYMLVYVYICDLSFERKHKWDHIIHFILLPFPYVILKIFMHLFILYLPMGVEYSTDLNYHKLCSHFSIDIHLKLLFFTLKNMPQEAFLYCFLYI